MSTETFSDNRPKFNGTLSVLICAGPGLLRESLATILASFPFVEIVESEVEEINPFIQIYHSRPDIVFVDCSSLPQCFDLIRTIEDWQPRVNCIAITETIQCSKLALDNGAEAALIKGFNNNDLYQTIRRVVYNGRTGMLSFPNKIGN